MISIATNGTSLHLIEAFQGIPLYRFTVSGRLKNDLRDGTIFFSRQRTSSMTDKNQYNVVSVRIRVTFSVVRWKGCCFPPSLRFDLLRLGWQSNSHLQGGKWRTNRRETGKGLTDITGVSDRTLEIQTEHSGAIQCIQFNPAFLMFATAHTNMVRSIFSTRGCWWKSSLFQLFWLPTIDAQPAEDQPS